MQPVRIIILVISLHGSRFSMVAPIDIHIIQEISVITNI